MKTIAIDEDEERVLLMLLSLWGNMDPRPILAALGGNTGEVARTILVALQSAPPIATGNDESSAEEAFRATVEICRELGWARMKEIVYEAFGLETEAKALGLVKAEPQVTVVTTAQLVNDETYEKVPLQIWWGCGGCLIRGPSPAPMFCPACKSPEISTRLEVG